MLTVALDIYGTYDADPDTWDAVIDLLQEAGHTVIAVSGGFRGMVRHDGYKRLEARGIPVYFTEKRAKKAYLARNCGIAVDVIIDDNPIKWLKSTR